MLLVLCCRVVEVSLENLCGSLCLNICTRVAEDVKGGPAKLINGAFRMAWRTKAGYVEDPSRWPFKYPDVVLSDGASVWMLYAFSSRWKSVLEEGDKFLVDGQLRLRVSVWLRPEDR